jgi:hypothetical protein
MSLIDEIIKGESMIDLSKPQILTAPVKCWVSDARYHSYVEGWLLGRRSDMMYVTVQNKKHSAFDNPTLSDVQLLHRTSWTYCTLTDPYAKTEKSMTNA